MKPDFRERASPSPLTSLMVYVSAVTVMTSVIYAVTDSDTGRTFILNPEYLPWEEARLRCQEMKGTLATIDQIHVVPEMGYDNDWIFWVGLRLNSLGNVTSQDNLTWEGGVKVSWTNWHEHHVNGGGVEGSCVSVNTTPPYAWVPRSCNETLPFVCEVAGGECRFTLTTHASLRFFNEMIVYMPTEGCLEECRTTRQVDCRSVEDSKAADLCQISSETRWTRPSDFIHGDRYWDYYQWTCVNGTYINGVHVTPTISPASSYETTTEAPSTTTTLETSTAEEDGELVCRRVKPITENDTVETAKEVKELQTLTGVYKEQNDIKKKTSTPDPRPSATYVGSLAVGLVLGVLGFIVCLDLVSLPRHIAEMNRRGALCGKCVKKLRKRNLLKKKKNAMRFSEYSERPPSVPKLESLAFCDGLPKTFRPRVIAEDEHIEAMYCSSNTADEDTTTPGPGAKVLNSKVERHLERIRRLEKEIGRRKVPLPSRSSQTGLADSAISTTEREGTDEEQGDDGGSQEESGLGEDVADGNQDRSNFSSENGVDDVAFTTTLGEDQGDPDDEDHAAGSSGISMCEDNTFSTGNGGCVFSMSSDLPRGTCKGNSVGPGTEHAQTHGPPSLHTGRRSGAFVPLPRKRKQNLNAPNADNTHPVLLYSVAYRAPNLHRQEYCDIRNTNDLSVNPSSQNEDNFYSYATETSTDGRVKLAPKLYTGNYGGLDSCREDAENAFDRSSRTENDGRESARESRLHPTARPSESSGLTDEPELESEADGKPLHIEIFVDEAETPEADYPGAQTRVDTSKLQVPEFPNHLHAFD